MTDCLFCKIVAKQIPSQGVYEDENIYAFLDIHPNNPGHVLVVPKRHYGDFLAADAGTLSAWIVATQKIARAVVVAMNTTGFNLQENNGTIAGQVVPHLHLHIVPRRADDGYAHWPGKTYQTGEDVEVAQKIKAALAELHL